MRPIRADDATHPRELPWVEGDPCELCGEDEDQLDPLGHFMNGDHMIIAHGQCGLDAHLELA